MDDLLDHLGELNDLTPRIKVSADQPVRPEVVFGLDTQLFLRKGMEGVDWNLMGGEGRHEDEVETRSVWRGGSRPKKSGVHDHGDGHGHAHEHSHADACDVSTELVKGQTEDDIDTESIQPIERETLERALEQLNFEIYRGTSYYPSSFLKIAEHPSSERDCTSQFTFS